MTDVTNLYPNPDLRTTDRSGVMVAGNYFPNPSPKVDLTGWTAVSGGTVTRTTAAALFSGDTTYGCRVTGGLNLAAVGPAGMGPSVTAKVRASAAMDITVSVTAEYSVYVQDVGWGDFGWGQTKTYVPGATKTFTTGEECLFRVYFRTDSTSPAYPHDGTDWHPVVTLTSSTSDPFDVDGVMEWVGVDDGDSVDYIPDAPLYFSGDTPAGGDFTYSWYGTPNASPSIQRASVPKHVASDYLYTFDPVMETPTGAFAVTVSGEHRVAWRSAVGFGQQDLKLTGVTYVAGKNYVISYDIIEDSQFYHSGYEEPVFEGAWYPSVYENHLGYNVRVNQHYVSGLWPYRKRAMVPFAMTTGLTPWACLQSSQDWLTGDVHVTNVAINEIATIYHSGDLDLSGTGIADLTAMGLAAGAEATIAWESFDTPTPTCTIEYTTDGTTWTTITTMGGTAGLTGDQKIDGHLASFTVPSGATGTRLSMSAPGWLYSFDLFDTPPPYFNGATADGGGYTYAWAGTPYDSPSIRSVASGGSPEAKVFIGGTAVAATEIRIQTGGGLYTITDLRGV